VKDNTRKLCISAIAGGLYAALTLILAPISFGAVQCRVSELVCIVPFFIPEAAWGLFLGCALANLFSGNIFDVVFGSLATLAAALATAALGRLPRSRKSRILACSMPVVFNSVIVSAVITWGYEGMNIFSHLPLFGINALWIGLGEAAVMLGAGLPLMYLLEKKHIFRY